MFSNNFYFLLALRYLKPKRTFLFVISLVSVLGVALGVALLIIVISVMTGFEREMQRKVLGFEPHVVITNSGVMEDWPEVLKAAGGVPDVLAAAPFVLGPVLVEHEHRRMAPKIRGVDPTMEEKVTGVRDFIIAGKYDLDGDKTVLGSDLARTLGAAVGDKITVYSPGNLDGLMEELDRMEREGSDKASVTTLRQMVLPTELEVTGIFESGRYAYDSEFLLVPLHIGQEIYNLGGGVHGLALHIKDPYRATEVREKLDEVIGGANEALTWIDLNRQIFDAVRMERHVMFVILMVVIVVAAFCIMNTQITTTVQKTRDIGVMKALGARILQIVSIFVAQGIIIGVFGTLTGLLLGMVTVHFRNEFSHWLASTLHIEVFPRAVYQFSEIPAEIVPGDVLVICVSAFVICSLAALLPAWFAARLDPVKALRYE